MISFKQFLSEDTVLYNWDEIESIAVWQNYGSSGIDKNIYKVQKKLPENIKRYSGDAYRFVFLSPKHWKTVLDGKLIPNRKLESYTTSLQMAKRLSREIGESDHVDSTYILAFIKYRPSPNQIFINIEALWKNTDWRRSVDFYVDKKKYFNEGLDFEGSQKEVILQNLPGINISNVVEAYNFNGKRVK